MRWMNPIMWMEYYSSMLLLTGICVVRSFCAVFGNENRWCTNRKLKAQQRSYHSFTAIKFHNTKNKTLASKMEWHSISLRTVWDSQYTSPKKQFSPLAVAQKPAEFITNQKVPWSQTILHNRTSDQNGAVWKSPWFLWRCPGSRTGLLSPRLPMLN